MAVKILEKQIVPPVPNFKEPDPELGTLNLSKGGHYPVRFALRLAAGFGSQIAMSLFRRIQGVEQRIADQPTYQRWLAEVSGYDAPSVEVQQRTLRIKDEGQPRREPAQSRWLPGAGPSAVVADATTGGGTRPAFASNLGSSWLRLRPRPRLRPLLRPRPGTGCRRIHPRKGPRHCGREDRLSARHAGSRSGSRGGSRHRHGQAGRGVRDGARDLQHSSPGQPEAARLSDAAPRGRLRRAEQGGSGPSSDTDTGLSPCTGSASPRAFDHGSDCHGLRGIRSRQGAWYRG
jgi:hypothetical protein